LRNIALGLPVYTARFPNRRYPRPPLPHSSKAFGFIDPHVCLIDLASLSQGDGRGNTKSHRARLAHVALRKPAVANLDAVRPASEALR
jgi:hypothetical protein